MKKISLSAVLVALGMVSLASSSMAQESAKLQAQDYLDIRQLIDRYAHIQRAAGSGGSPARR